MFRRLLFIVPLLIAVPAYGQVQPRAVDARTTAKLRAVSLAEHEAAIARMPLALPQQRNRPNPPESPAQQQTRIRALNVQTGGFRPIVTAPVTIAVSPHIAQLNGKASGNFEPGGQYRITGRGFGSGGTAFLQHPQLRRTVTLKILHWADSSIYAEMPTGITGVPDIQKVELIVGPRGGKALQTDRFGFYATRAEAPVTSIPATAWTRGGFREYLTWHNQETLRYKNYPNPDVACYRPGVDRLAVDRTPLKPGFRISSFRFSPTKLESDVRSGMVEARLTPFGTFAARWEDGDNVIVDWGIQRFRVKPPFETGFVSCTSRYKLQLFATGPAGLPAQ